MNEIWKPILGYEEYYKVSNFGRISSLDRIVNSRGGKRTHIGKVLKPSISNDGYYVVDLCKDGERKTHRVHRIVGNVFVDPSWTGEFDHIDTNPLNNISTNLRVASRQQQLFNQNSRAGSSKYKGVSKSENKKNPWRASIGFNGSNIKLGYFRTETLAAREYNKAAINLFGQYYRLNPPTLQPVKNPNSWSCLLASFSSILEIPLDTLIQRVGDDGGEITHPGLPDPVCRRGFHPQQFIKICLEEGNAITRVEFIPTATSGQDLPLKLFKNDEWFLKQLFNSYGVLDSRTNIGLGHAMSYEGRGDHTIICDPANGDVFKLEKLKDAEERNRYVHALWRIDRIKSYVPPDY